MSSRTGKALHNYDDLYRYSVDNPADFWSALWDFTKVSGDKGSGEVLRDGDKMPGAQYFPDAQLNFAENLLRHGGTETAVVFRGEDKVEKRLSWDELNAEVRKVSRALKDAGVVAGDRVAAILPNMPESIAGVLGTAALGAVWSSCSPDFGVQGVLDRFGQIEPKVLFVCDGYYYNGKAIDISGKLAEIVAKLSSVREVVVVPYLERDRDASTPGSATAGAGPEPGATPSAPGRRSPSRSSAFRSRTPSTYSFRPARQACPNA